MPTTIPSTFGFYAILTDPLRGYDYCTKLLVDHEVAFVQLRMKECPVEEVRSTAERMRKITEGSVTRFIVNDFPDVAREVGADGVHVGQNDMPLEQARETVGADCIVGLSTHSPQQTENACRRKPDYIGVGPVYATPTKKIPDPPIGIETMKAMLSMATVPAVVLGSITLENLPQILQAGAQNFCMVRPLNQSPNPETILAEILQTYRSHAL